MTASRVQRLFFALLVAFMLNAITAMSARAADYYVATTGNNSNDGSAASPWRTIKYAVNKMNAGDTTYVKGGVYNEAPWFGRSGTASARISLLNAPGELPVIDCGNDDFNFLHFQNSTSYTQPVGYITLEGFEIRNCRNGIKMYNGHDIIIRRNWIHHSRSQGIDGNGKNILIDRNVINRSGNFAGCAVNSDICNKEHGIYGTGTSWVVTNNLIYDNLSYGVHVAGYPKCEHSGCAYIKRYTDDSYGGADNWLIANNTIAYHHYRPGIALWQARTTNSRIINNIFYENSQKSSGEANGVGFTSSGGGHVIQNNLCYATAPGGTACIGSNGAGKYTASNNITADPSFVSAGPTISGVPDFHLQSSSPAIDKGLSLSEVTWDHAGGKRPFGPSFDIGAYEHGSPPDSGSPPPNPTGGVPPAVARPPSTYNPGASLCP